MPCLTNPFLHSYTRLALLWAVHRLGPVGAGFDRDPVGRIRIHRGPVGRDPVGHIGTIEAQWAVVSVRLGSRIRSDLFWWLPIGS